VSKRRVSSSLSKVRSARFRLMRSLALVAIVDDSSNDSSSAIDFGIASFIQERLFSSLGSLVSKPI
jgi:hypothetical protein